MAKDPNKPRKARKGLSEVKPKQRLNYVSIRIGEITNELERLKAERTTLREKLGKDRATKKGVEETPDED